LAATLVSADDGLLVRESISHTAKPLIGVYWYSRAEIFGDHYQVWAEETDLSVCYPSDPHEDDDADAASSGLSISADGGRAGRWHGSGFDKGDRTWYSVPARICMTVGVIASAVYL
jgi:hypothetical protein